LALFLKLSTDLLKDVFKGLKFKKRLLKYLNLQLKIKEFWSVIDHRLSSDTTTKKALKIKEDICAFICQVQHYSLQIKKCGSISCHICKPVCLVFKSLHYLPDPVPGDDSYYKSFEELYSSTTTEYSKKTNKRHTLPNSMQKMLVL